MGSAVRLHALSLLAEDFEEVLEGAWRFFAAFGVGVEILSTGHLIGHAPDLPIMATDPSRLTLQQILLYAHRAPWPREEVVVFFVNSLPPMLCRGFSNPGLNVCLVAKGAPRLTLAHELGHLLGLDHVEDVENLMHSRGPRGESAVLEPSQLSRLRRSPLLLANENTAPLSDPVAT